MIKLRNYGILQDSVEVVKHTNFQLYLEKLTIDDKHINIRIGLAIHQTKSVLRTKNLTSGVSL